jgi:hypothetical protein
MLESSQARFNRRGRGATLATDMIKRLLTPTTVLGLGLALGSCGSVAGAVADHWPHWAGGMSNDVPPRPGAPGYDEFIAHDRAKTVATTPAATGEKTDAQAAPSGNRPPNDQAAAQGGLY